MNQTVKIPSPSEVMQMRDISVTPVQEELINSLVNILKTRYVGKTLSIKLKEIKSNISITLEDSIKNYDRDVLEAQMSRSGRKMIYDGPGYSESYDDYYKVSDHNNNPNDIYYQNHFPNLLFEL